MDWFFDHKENPQEAILKSQRILYKGMKAVDRERAKIQLQEPKIIADIQNMVNAGQQVTKGRS